MPSQGRRFAIFAVTSRHADYFLITSPLPPPRYAMLVLFAAAIRRAMPLEMPPLFRHQRRIYAIAYYHAADTLTSRQPPIFSACRRYFSADMPCLNGHIYQYENTSGHQR